MAAGLDAPFPSDAAVMQRALELALRGRGRVEPNPAVGAVIVDGERRRIAEGWHERFGGPHAEVVALRQAGDAARGAELFVTLEPCSHFGKTPPCTQAIIAAGIRRVVIAAADPAPHTAGQGLAELRRAGIPVELGLCGAAGAALIAPFTALCTLGRPSVIAKWAMTLDGKLATRTGASRWISNESSRRRVHELRGRMDAILIGSQTALADDPLLTARPPGPRTPARVVLDTQARLPATSQLARTVGEAPVIIVTGPDADAERCRKLADLGVQIWAAPSAGPAGGVDLRWVLAEMGRRQWTNLLVEGGARTLGALRDADLIDEVHCFIASKLAGGAGAPSPLGGLGLEEMPEAMSLIAPAIEILDGDVYVQGRVRRGDRVGAA